MIKFIGEYSAKIDDKGRLVLPSAFRAAMSAEAGDTQGAANMQLVIKKDIYVPCLEVYTYEEWSRESEELKARLNFLKRDDALFWRTYMRGRALVTPDSKLGRISIPKELLDSIGAVSEVVFCGNDHKIEIWSKENYEACAISDEEFTSLAEKLSE